MSKPLDLGKAWESAVAMLSANKDVVLIVAAVFFFLPNAVSGVLVPPATDIEAIMASSEPNPQALLNAIWEYLGSVWWVYAIITVVSGIGTISLLALLTNKNRPTVGDAISIGVKSVLTYIGVQVLLLILALLVILLPAALGFLIFPPLAILLYLLGFVVAVYFYIKFSLASPIIAIDGERNPLNAMARSWRLTKGNSLRIFAFYLLLIIALVVLTLLFGLFLGIFALFGEQIGLFVGAIGGSLFGMLTTSVIVAVLGAVHQQLSDSPAAAVGDTFD